MFTININYLHIHTQNNFIKKIVSIYKSQFLVDNTKIDLWDTKLLLKILINGRYTSEFFTIRNPIYISRATDIIYRVGHLKRYKLLSLKIYIIAKNVSDKSYLTRKGT